MSNNDNKDPNESMLHYFMKDGIRSYTDTIYKMGYEQGEKEAKAELKKAYSRPWHWAPLSFLIGIMIGCFGGAIGIFGLAIIPMLNS